MAYPIVCRDGTRCSVRVGVEGDLLVSVDDEPALATCGLAPYVRRQPGSVSVTLFAAPVSLIRKWVTCHDGLDKEASSSDGVLLLRAIGRREIDAVAAEEARVAAATDSEEPGAVLTGNRASWPAPRYPAGTCHSVDHWGIGATQGLKR